MERAEANGEFVTVKDYKVEIDVPTHRITVAGLNTIKAALTAALKAVEDLEGKL